MKAPRIPRSRWIFHSQWILLNREAAASLAEDDFTSWFESVFAPDECYPGTILQAKGYPLEERVVNADPTWTDWRGGSSPVSWSGVSSQKAANLAVSGAFFARKVNTDSDLGMRKLHI